MLRGWRELIAEAPRHATLTAWTGTAGDWPLLPAEHHNSPLASVGYIYVGEPDQGRRLLLRALRGLAPPLAEQVEELTYLELQTIDDAKQRQRLRRYWKGHYLREPRRGDRGLPGAGRPATAIPSCYHTAASRAMAARSLRWARTRPRSATEMRWSSSWPSRPGRPYGG